MFSLKESYNRPLNIGDIVLVKCGGKNLCGNVLIEIGNEYKTIPNNTYFNTEFSDTSTLICYKLEDSYIKNAIQNYNYFLMEQSFQSAGVPFIDSYESIYYTQIVEMFNRKLSPGDFVLYDIRKTKGDYGVVIGSKEIFTDKGNVIPINSVYLLTELSPEEEKVRESMLLKYREYTNSLSFDTSKTLSEIVRGDIFLSEDNKYIYYSLGECKYDFCNININQHLLSPDTKEYYLKFPSSLKLSKSLLNKNFDMTFEDLVSALKFKNNDICMLDPYWDINDIKLFRKWEVDNKLPGSNVFELLDPVMSLGKDVLGFKSVTSMIVTKRKVSQGKLGKFRFLGNITSSDDVCIKAINGVEIWLRLV